MDMIGEGTAIADKLRIGTIQKMCGIVFQLTPFIATVAGMDHIFTLNKDLYTIFKLVKELYRTGNLRPHMDCRIKDFTWIRYDVP